ncbi:MAG: response regulator [Opitutaceae bacterium]
MTARILLIEDEPALRQLLMAALSKAGHSVVVANDGREGTALLTQQPVDLVITDMLMPNSDGIEMMLGLRQTHPQLPIIAMTGGHQLGPDYYLRIAKTLGASRLLQKPFPIADLLGAVDALMLPPA